MALPIASTIGLVMPNPDNLHQAVLALLGGLQDPSYLQRFAAGLTSKMLLPTLAVFALLWLTRLGSWLAPNRLAAGCLAGASFIIVLVAVLRLYLAANGKPAYLPGSVNDVLTPVVVSLLAVGLTALMASTIWHRLITDKARVKNAARVLLREL